MKPLRTNAGGGLNRIARGAALLMAAILLTACGASKPVDDPRPLTANEAELLASTRLVLGQQGTVPVHMDWPGTPATTIDAVLDLKTGYAYGTATTPASAGMPEMKHAIAWSTQRLATAPWTAGQKAAPDVSQWEMRSITTSNGLDLFLAIALSLGADRPDNPLLVRQSTARYLRADKVDGVAVSVMSGPQEAGQTGESRTRYWIDAEGNLKEFQANLNLPNKALASITMVKSVNLPKDLSSVAAQVVIVQSVN